MVILTWLLSFFSYKLDLSPTPGNNSRIKLAAVTVLFQRREEMPYPSHCFKRLKRKEFRSEREIFYRPLGEKGQTFHHFLLPYKKCKGQRNRTLEKVGKS